MYEKVLEEFFKDFDSSKYIPSGEINKIQINIFEPGAEASDFTYIVKKETSSYRLKQVIKKIKKNHPTTEMRVSPSLNETYTAIVDVFSSYRYPAKFLFKEIVTGLKTDRR